jgi:hypothetical protein
LHGWLSFLLSRYVSRLRALLWRVSDVLLFVSFL